MEDFNFITIRLGKDSVSDIKRLYSSSTGIIEQPFDINVRCTQVPETFSSGDYAFVWLGSDNNKGMPTNWKQGFKAVGVVKEVQRGKKYNDESLTTVSIVYVFRDSINRIDILRNNPIAYYWCSSMPLIGIDDHANQTIRLMLGDTCADIGAFFCSIESSTGYFKDEILKIQPDFKKYFYISVPNPKYYPNVKSLSNITTVP